MNCKDLFDLYVSEASSAYKEWLKHPNINSLDGKVWATDGHAALIVPVALAGGDYPKREMKTEIPVPAEEQRTITIAQIEEAVAKCDKEEVMEDVKEVCPECSGEGVVEWEYDATTNRETYDKEFECPVCDGDGYIWNEKPSGKFEPSRKCAISIGAGLFTAWQIDRIAKTMRMIGADTITVVSEPTKSGALLLHTGDVEILQMPVFEPDKVCASL